MSHSVRRLLTAAATVSAFAIAAPVAGAEQITTPNACQGSDGKYGDLPLQLSATAGVNGRQLDVSASQPSVAVPAWLPEKLQPAALVLGPGTHNVKVDAWMAVAGAGSADAPKVLTTNGNVSLVITGNLFSYTINSVTLTLGASAATSWKAPDAGGTVSVGQAPAGSLPAIPAGANNATVTPKGSLFIRGSVNTGIGSTTLLIDCQPGSTGGDGSTLSASFTPGAAPVLVSGSFGAGATTPTPTPTPAGPATLTIASPTLKFGSAAVLVSVACPAGKAPCTGAITLTSAKKLKVGKGKAKLRKLGAGTYSVPAGTTAPVKVKLSADGKKLRKKALVAKVTLKPSSGTAVAKNLRANG